MLRRYHGPSTAAGLPRQPFQHLRTPTRPSSWAPGAARERVRMLGHANLGTTADLYAHLAPATARRAADTDGPTARRRRMGTRRGTDIEQRPSGIPRGPHSCSGFWSGRDDSNVRPPEPHSGALPGCATPRQNGQSIRRARRRGPCAGPHRSAWRQARQLVLRAARQQVAQRVLRRACRRTARRAPRARWAGRRPAARPGPAPPHRVGTLRDARQRRLDVRPRPPAASSMPSRWLRDSGEAHVARMSPMPASPAKVSGLAPGRDAQAGDLREAAGDDGGLAVVAQAAARRRHRPRWPRCS